MKHRARIRVVLCVIVALLAMAPPAWAHTDISGSTPADGATLKRAPATVTINFSQPPLPSGMAMVAEGPGGQIPLSPKVVGSALVASWPQQAGAGDFAVTYRVVASDGHPITGKLAFRIAGKDTAEPRSNPTPAATVAAQPGAAEGSGPSAGILALVVVALLVVVGAWVVVRRGRTP